MIPRNLPQPLIGKEGNKIHYDLFRNGTRIGRMLRTLFIIFVSVATLLTAAGWWMQLTRLNPPTVQITWSVGLSFNAADWMVGLSIMWIEQATGMPVDTQELSRHFVPGLQVGLKHVWWRQPGLSTGIHELVLIAPLWIPTVLVAAAWLALPFASRRRRRRLRRKRGLCVKCGYDLQGNESGVCPECGVEVG